MKHLFFTILLQVDPMSWLQKLADQGLSLAILGILAYLFWKQINKLQAQQDKYMQEDRKELIDALNNNTKVMERNTVVMESLKDILNRKP